MKKTGVDQVKEFLMDFLFMQLIWMEKIIKM